MEEASQTGNNVEVEKLEPLDENPIQNLEVSGIPPTPQTQKIPENETVENPSGEAESGELQPREAENKPPQIREAEAIIKRIEEEALREAIEEFIKAQEARSTEPERVEATIQTGNGKLVKACKTILEAPIETLVETWLSREGDWLEAALDRLKGLEAGAYADVAERLGLKDKAVESHA